MKYLLPLLFIFCVLNTRAQKNDYQWLFGYDNYAAADTDFGGVTMDFDSTYPILTRHVRLGDMNECNASYCNDSGRLLFYTNGGDIFDGRDSVMLGGDSINYGWYWDDNLGFSSTARYSGLGIPQGALALPAPGDSLHAYLIHYIVNYCSFPDTISSYLTDSSLYSLINLNENNGWGEVVKKDVVVNTDTLAGSYLSAVQHGNGKDWWILHPYYYGNCYYEFLLTDTGVGLYNIQCLGDSMLGFGDIGTSCFSPDGSKYFWVNSYDGIRMFDFDRCTGTLSNTQSISFPTPAFADSNILIAGIAVSPNNRYLYIIALTAILQYDLMASNIDSSVDTVAIYDGSYYENQPLNRNTFFMAQLGPDGKIYVNAPNGTKSLCVINQPDLRGDSCQVTQHSFYLHTYNSFSIPNFPNYRLGAWQGSACDSLSVMTTEVRALKEQLLKVFPNPATDMVTVDYGFTDWNKGAVSLEITDALGRLVYNQPLPMYSGYQKINIAPFAAGTYNIFIKRSNGIVAVNKLVVVH